MKEGPPLRRLDGQAEQLRGEGDDGCLPHGASGDADLPDEKVSDGLAGQWVSGKKTGEQPTRALDRQHGTTSR